MMRDQVVVPAGEVWEVDGRRIEWLLDLTLFGPVTRGHVLIDGLPPQGRMLGGIFIACVKARAAIVGDAVAARRGDAPVARSDGGVRLSISDPPLPPGEAERLPGEIARSVPGFTIKKIP